MFCVGLHTSCTLRLPLVGMEFSVSKEHRVLFVLVEMGEGVVSLGVVEPEDHHCERADKMLLERKLGELSCLVGALASEQVVFAFVELFLDVALKHF